MSYTDLDIDMIRGLGILQEVNRRLLHPRGLALYVENRGGNDPRVGIFAFDNPTGDGAEFVWEEGDHPLTKSGIFDALLKRDWVQSLPEEDL